MDLINKVIVESSYINDIDNMDVIKSEFSFEEEEIQSIESDMKKSNFKSPNVMKLS